MTNNNTYTYGFDQCTTTEEVKNRLRNLSKILHPDHNGDPLLFMNCKEEAERRIAELEGRAQETNEPPHPRPRARKTAKATPPINSILNSLLQNPDVQKYVANTIADLAPKELRGIVSGIAAHLTDKK